MIHHVDGPYHFAHSNKYSCDLWSGVRFMCEMPVVSEEECPFCEEVEE